MKKNITYALFSLLNKAHISYAVLRNYESLPQSCGGSDLDIVVKRTDCPKFYEILSEAAKLTDSKLVSYTDGSTSPKVCYLNCMGGIQIDVFQGSICCKGCVMIPETDILMNAITYNGIQVLDSSYGNLIAFLKEILNNGNCSEKYTKPLLENKSTYSLTYLSEKLSLFSMDFVNLLNQTIQDGNFDLNVSEIAYRGRKCLGITGYRDTICKFLNLRRLFRPTGYTIAVLGTDGSGKSFIINSITPILNEAFHKGIRYEHMRPNYLPSIAVLMGRKSKDDVVAVCSDPHAGKTSGLIGSIIRFIYYWIDYTWGYFCKIYPDKTLKTHVWLFDRYFYDYYVDQKRACIKLPSFIIKFFGWFVPAPDLTICLGGNPEKIYERKPETSLEEVKRQTNILKSFTINHKNTIWVDTTKHPSESINDTMVAIIEMMSKRFNGTMI